jgi:muramidase (phage lysozyme)
MNEYLDNPNVKAFLLLIRRGEGTLGEDGYRTLYGGSHFSSFADHPRTAIKAGKWLSTAAGAYQFLERTWDSLCHQHPELTDFSPHNQDLGALWLISGRAGLSDVLKGDISQAIGKCNREWASLPGSPYGQPTQKMEDALAFYKDHGGTFHGRY